MASPRSRSPSFALAFADMPDASAAKFEGLASQEEVAKGVAAKTPSVPKHLEVEEVGTVANDNCPECLKSCWGPDDGVDAEVQTSRLSAKKGVLFVVFIMISYSVVAAAFVSEPPESVVPEASNYRALVQFVLAGNMILAIMVDIFGFPSTKKDQEAYALYQGAGKPVFLTFWILTIQLVFSIACFEVEFGLLIGWPRHQLLSLNYQSAVFVDTLGVVLTFLFLRFNYFEENWRRDVMEYWEKRGYPWGRRSLVVHVLPLPVALIDLLAKNATAKEWFTPSFWQNALAVVVFTVMYMSWMHLWWYVSNYTAWPYPFIHNFRTPLSRVAFGVALVVGICIVMLPMQFFLVRF